MAEQRTAGDHVVDPTPGAWCILRMAPSRTMKVAESLARAGFEVWTPVENQVRRLPRSKVRQARQVMVMPTYLFARAHQIVDLLALSKAPGSPHPDFSVFRHHDRFPLIADESLNHLRMIEKRTAPKQRASIFTAGDEVKLTEGSFAGMNGVVETSKGQYSLVTFSGWAVPIKIASLLLLPVHVQCAEPEQGTAAEAA